MKAVRLSGKTFLQKLDGTQFLSMVAQPHREMRSHFKAIEFGCEEAYRVFGNPLETRAESLGIQQLSKLLGVAQQNLAKKINDFRSLFVDWYGISACLLPCGV